MISDHSVPCRLDCGVWVEFSDESKSRQVCKKVILMHNNIHVVAPQGLAKPPVTKLWSNLDCNKKRVEPNYDLLIVFLTGINVGKNCRPIKI